MYKPPFVDGDFFSSVFEEPKSFRVSRVVARPMGIWRAYVRFRDDPSGYSWEDSVLVVLEGGRYQIDDVLYSGAGPFNPPGRLSDALSCRDEN